MILNQEIMDIVEAIRQTVSVEKIYLFGSYAYGKPNDDSDYDFFIILPDNGIGRAEAALKARKAIRQVKRKTPVDILTDYQSRFNERKQYNTLERKIFREGVVVYG